MTEGSGVGQAPVVLSKSTLIPVTVVISALAVCGSVVGWLDSRFTTIDKALEQQDRRLEKLEGINGDRWLGSDMELWAERLKGANPNLTIPAVNRAH